MEPLTTTIKNEIETRTGKKLPRFTEIPIGYLYHKKKKFTGIGYVDDWMQQLFWMEKGRLHRIDGPAVIDSCNKKYFYIHGIEYKEENFWNHSLIVDYKLRNIIEL